MDQVKSMMDTLSQIREKYGEEKFQYAAKQSARMLIAQGPEMREAVRDALKGIVDVDALDNEPPPVYPTGNLPDEQVMMQAIRQAMPGVQTQAQFNVVLAAFDAVKVTLNAIFLGDKARAEKGREAIQQAIETAEKVTDLSSKLGHVPEAATSKAAEEFKNPPAQFTEYDTYKGLIGELEVLASGSELSQWYTTNRARIDRVISQSLRNQLFDSIRQKQTTLSS